MKLIYCPHCGDVRALAMEVHRSCECGKSFGRYTDSLNAEIGGEAIPLGFANNTFRLAVQRQPESGEGERFTAFVIPKVCDTVKGGSK